MTRGAAACNISTVTNDYGKLRIHYVGQLKSSASWAHVGREMVLALDRLGCDISASSARGYHHAPHFPLPPRIIEIFEKEPHDDIILTFSFPPNYPNLRGRLKAGILVYESTKVPQNWVDAINSHMDLLLVPSSYTRYIMVESGVREELAAVVPHGYDPNLFHENAEPGPRLAGGKYTFLSLAVPHRRKGIELLLKAFTLEFGRGEPAALVIHSTYAPKPGNEKIWETTDTRTLAYKVRQKYSGPSTIIAETGVIPIEDVPSYIGACDCYVQPSMSEGFGMAILEAMALAKPVIATGWSGHMDFCNKDNSYLIDYDIIRAREIQYDNDDPEALIASPRLDSLRKIMRHVFENREEAKERGRIAAESIRHLTWDNAAKTLADMLMKLREEKG